MKSRITAIIGILTVLSCPFMCSVTSASCAPDHVDTCADGCCGHENNSNPYHKHQDAPGDVGCCDWCFCKAAVWSVAAPDVRTLSFSSVLSLPTSGAKISVSATADLLGGGNFQFGGEDLRVALRSLLC